MSSSLLRRLAGAAALALVGAAGASDLAAQTAAPSGATASEAPRTAVLSFQPLWIPALLFSGEYERAANENFTLGVGASYWTVDELSLTSVDAAARFYPTAALRGFAVGLTGGYTRAHEDYEGGCDPEFGECDESLSGATVGARLDYQWLVGRQDKYAIALGLGIKRFVGVDEEEDGLDDIGIVYPTFRASFGFAF